MTTVLSFSPKEVTEKLIVVLPDRAQQIIVARYGLDKQSKKETLESIGTKYGITRERVRQIENHSLKSIRKSEEYGREKESFGEIEALIQELGAVVVEDHLLDHISEDEKTQNHSLFLLVLGEAFQKKKEDNHMKHRWFVDQEVHDTIEEALKNLYAGLGTHELVNDTDIVKRFVSEIEEMAEHHRKEEIVKRWLSLSKKIGKNPLDEWGRASSPNVKVKGMRDYAYLVLRRHGSPMHFTEVANAVKKLFGKEAHTATTHNELIKDKRFVLVGRGLYALNEWGYMKGVVRDVITEVLRKEGPLTKEDVIDHVTRERYVKPNTIVVNLQNNDIFEKLEDGKYALAE